MFVPEMKTDELTAIARRIKLIIFDVDGVMTNGKITYDTQGNEFKSFDVKDGARIFYARRLGLICAIITGRESAIVSRRAQELGISDVFQNAKYKRDCFENLLEKYHLTAEETAYFGDDFLDLPVMKRVGLPVAPADAAPEVRQIAKIVTTARGGDGAVAEGVEFILRAQGHWDTIVETALVDRD